MNALLWFASRGTGVVSILLCTAVLLLGLVTAGRRRPGGDHAAVTMGLHRTLALGSLAFLVAHIGTAIAETYVSLDAISAIVPFTSGYERIWVGLGTLAVDLLIALVGTSLVRHRLPEKLWRTVHLMAFAAWLMAIVHGLALGTTSEPVLRGITLGCAAAGLAAAAWRVGTTTTDADHRRRIARQEWI